MGEQSDLKKTSFGLKIAYSFGQVTDSVPYNLFYIYFLFFFSDVAGLSPAFGGTISLVIILWSAVVDPIVGYLSDRTKSKSGRRRPFMLAGSVPLFLFIVLMYTTVDFGAVGSYVYYLIIGMLMWTAYTIYVTPFMALGAELTQNYKDRNDLRTVAAIFIYLTVWAVTALPMLIWDKVAIAGGSDQRAWVISAIVLGAIGFVSGLIAWNFTRGKELSTGSDVIENANTKVDTKFFKNYMELLKQRPTRNISLFMVFMCISFAINSAALVFLMSNNMGLSETTQAFYWTCFTVITIVIIPLIGFFANKVGKKNSLVILCSITIVCCVFFYITDIDTFTELIIYTIFYQFGNSGLWILGFSLGYDCVEVDEFRYGARREAAITSLISFCQKLGGAIGMWVSGILLTAFSYDYSAVEQTAHTEHGILLLNTIFTGGFMAIAVIFLMMYPINSRNYHALIEATKLKKAGKEYSTDGFSELLK